MNHQESHSSMSRSSVKFIFYALTAAGLLFPSAGFAHTVHGSGFVAGITHPIVGIDHLLAMLSVGILSSLLGGYAIWLLPVTFVTVMVLGAGTALSDIVVHGQEIGIVLSVFILGAAIVYRRKISVVLVMIVVAMFAFFHGYAHGAELPGGVSAYLFVTGFAIATAAIHVTGVFIAHFAARCERSLLLLRFAGAFFCGIGFQMLLSMGQ